MEPTKEYTISDKLSDMRDVSNQCSPSREMTLAERVRYKARVLREESVRLDNVADRIEQNGLHIDVQRFFGSLLSHQNPNI